MGYKHNKADIIAEGATLIRKKGYHHIGVNDILKACEIPKGSFYNFFVSKEDFATKALRFYANDYMDHMQRYLVEGKGSAIDRIEKFYLSRIEKQVRDGLNGGCLLHNLSTEVGGQSEEIANTAKQCFAEWMMVLSATIRQAQAEGSLDSSIDALSIAQSIQSGYFGALSHMKMMRSRAVLDAWLSTTLDMLKLQQAS